MPGHRNQGSANAAGGHLLTLERLLEIEQGWWLTESRTRTYSPRGLGRTTDATRPPSSDEEDWRWVERHATFGELRSLRRFFDEGEESSDLELWRLNAVDLPEPYYGDAPLCGEELARLDAAGKHGAQNDGASDRDEGRAIARDLRRQLGALRTKSRSEAAKRKPDGGLNKS